MEESFKVRSTSRSSATVDVRELSCTGTTRKVVYANLHENPNNAEASVKITIAHQRKGKRDEWEDVESIALNTLKAGEGVKLELKSEETLALRGVLEGLYAIYERKGIPWGDRELVVADARDIIRADRRRATLIRELLSQGHSEEVWGTLVDEDPDLATRLSDARLQQQRKKGLDEFRRLLDGDVNEDVWQKFFNDNLWIFGYGLDYRILELVQSQPDYGGRSVRGRGSQRGDHLTATTGDVRFTVLVEIKKPTTPLLADKWYRNRAYPPSADLSGGIAQLQASCQTWGTEGSRTNASRDELGDILTVKPKGILVIGRGNELRDRDRRISFELLRRSTLNPEIITFDELFARAKFIVHGRAAASSPAEIDSQDSDDEVPF